MATRNRFVFTLIAAALLSGAAACSEMNQQNIFEPEVGHPESWVADHGDAALSRGESCTECHGTDLGGGVSGLSCFTLSFNSGGCHESGGELRHTEGWELPREHGKAAMGRPGVSTGMGSCQACHGLDYDGGTSEVPCSQCHGVDAPHPAAPWTSMLSAHDLTDELNADFCIDCHRSEDEKGLGLPGCYNGSLCHGEKGIHSEDWALPENHGLAAVGDPFLSGLEECALCHGEDYSGGTSGVSCFPCHGIEAVHPVSGWLEGGEGHYDVHEGNAPSCAVCHVEFAPPPACFTANDCHEAVPGEDAPVDTLPPSEDSPSGGTPPEEPLVLPDSPS